MSRNGGISPEKALEPAAKQAARAPHRHMAGSWRDRNDGQGTKINEGEDRAPGLAPVAAARGLFTAYRDAIGRLDEALGKPFEDAVGMTATSAMSSSAAWAIGLIGRKIARRSPRRARRPVPSSCRGDPWRPRHGPFRRRDDPDFQFRRDRGDRATSSGAAAARCEDHRADGGLTSSMARAAEIVLDISVDREACPLNLAPTTSAMNTLVWTMPWRWR